MSAFDVTIATAKINISAPCVKASRLELYCCRTLSACRCIVAPDSRSNHMKSCRKNIVHWEKHNFPYYDNSIRFVTAIRWRFDARENCRNSNGTFIHRTLSFVASVVSLSQFDFTSLSSQTNRSWRTTAIDVVIHEFLIANCHKEPHHSVYCLTLMHAVNHFYCAMIQRRYSIRVCSLVR